MTAVVPYMFSIPEAQQDPQNVHLYSVEDLLQKMSGEDIVAAINVELGGTSWQTDTDTQLTNSQVVAAINNELGSSGWQTQHFKGVHASLSALQAAHPSGVAGDYADVDMGTGDDAQRYIWDGDDGQWIPGSTSGSGHSHANLSILDAITASYTTAEQSKLAGIAPNATANATDADLRDRTTHTGEQAISTITGLQDALDDKLEEFPIVDLEVADLSTMLATIVESAEDGELYWIKRDEVASQMSGCCNEEYTPNDPGEGFTILNQISGNLYPSGIVAGNILVLIQATHDDDPAQPITTEVAPATPTGFALFKTETSVRAAMTASYRIATGVETGTISDATADFTHLLVCEGPDPTTWETDLIAVSHYVSSPLDLVIAPPSIAGEVVVSSMSSDLTSPWYAANSGWTTVLDESNLVTWQRDTPIPANTDVGSPASTNSGADPVAGEHLLIFSMTVPAAASATNITIVETTAGDGSTVEVQTITIDSGVTAGTWTLGGESLDWDASISEVQAAVDIAYPGTGGGTPDVAGYSFSDVYPTAPQAGDVFVTALRSSTTGTPSITSGWTSIADGSGTGGGRYRILAKEATGSETGSMGHTITTTGRTTTVLLRGVDLASVVAAADYQWTGQAPQFNPVTVPAGGVVFTVGASAAGVGYVSTSSGFTAYATDSKTRIEYLTNQTGAVDPSGQVSDDDGEEKFALVVGAGPGSGSSDVVVSGSVGNYVLTWQAVGSQNLVTVVDVNLS